MDDGLKILLVEDMATDAELVLRELRRDGIFTDAMRVETRDDFIAAIRSYRPDIILSDFSLPRFDGFSALSVAREYSPRTPFIFVSGTIGEETAIAALKGGAIDYVLKTNLPRLGPAVRRAMSEARMRDARHRAEARFRDLIEYAPHAIVVFDERGAIKIVNAHAERLFGYAREHMLEISAADLIPPSCAQWHEIVNGSQCLAPNATVGFEASGCRQGGTEFPAEVSLSPLKTEDGLWVSAVIRDITERKQQEQRIARMTRIRTILGSINSVILRVRNKQRLLADACRIAHAQGGFAGAVVSMLEPSGSELKPIAWAGLDPIFLENLHVDIGQHLYHERGLATQAIETRCAAFTNDLQSDLRVVRWRAEFTARGYRSLFVAPLIVGERVAGLLSLFATEVDVFNDEEQRLLSELVGDISFALDFIDKEEQINYLACFDPLTGFANRSLFQDRLAQLIAARSDSDEAVALVLVDLERFRNVNHTLGRNAGDAFLREVAHRLRECVTDTAYLARLHADWFAFILKDVHSETDIVHWLDRQFFSCLSRPVRLQDESVHITMRAGIALYPNDGRDADTLLRNAEAALKNAKAAKARSLFYTEEMNARAAEKLSIESRLRRALEEEQFVLHYQPKVDLESGRIAGLEALIRWQAPGVGMLFPGGFIHVLEETGLIVEVGRWVVQQAHQQYQQWLARGFLPPRIAVNVSQLQIRQKDFLSNILHVLESAAPDELELEITESLLMDGSDENVAQRKLAALRETGVTVAIDDFGTGYSSLSYIARLPIDTLKIDRSFITDMTTSEDNRAIVSTIISLAHSLHFKVVAEGVETHEQEQMLRTLGCDQMQGFLHSHAMAPDELEAHLCRVP